MFKPITVIISDLHLGGGIQDPGDDHVYQGAPLVRMLGQLGSSKHGQKGEIELFINGDLFELAQVKPDLYTGGDFSTWASEDESHERLNIILKGHNRIFEALKAFQLSGNIVTMSAGNHDVDLYWPKAQEQVREVAGNVQFELGKTWYSRYGGQLQISHGHMEDPANKFESWENPILRPKHELARLEMCPGTLFMLKIVNVLEKDYPFVDNIKPVTALASLLWRASKREYAAVAWLLTKFTALHTSAALNTRPSGPGCFHKNLKDYARTGSILLERVRDVAEGVYRKSQSDNDLKAIIATEKKLLDFMMDVLRLYGIEGLKKLIPETGGTLATSESIGTLVIRQAGEIDEKKNLQAVAKSHFHADPTCEIIVMGHTHQPDDQSFKVGQRTTRYYNPGSWTRYADISKYDALTLEKLMDESKFPYQLNYVWIEDTGSGSLISKMETFQEDYGKPF